MVYPAEGDDRAVHEVESTFEVEHVSVCIFVSVEEADVVIHLEGHPQTHRSPLEMPALLDGAVERNIRTHTAPDAP